MSTPARECFRRLAERFERYAREAEKPQHLATDLAQLSVQAGRLREELSEQLPELGKLGLEGLTFKSEPERYSLLWVFNVGELAKEFPNRFRHNAAEWNWAHLAMDPEGRPLGKDRKPLRARRYRNGEPLPDDWQGNETHKGERYEWRLEGELAYQHDFYDAADALAHLRIRAEVSADACRVLDDLLQDHTAERARRLKPPGRRVDTDVREDARIAAAWAPRTYRTYADLGRELNITAEKVKYAIDRHRHRQPRARTNTPTAPE